MCGGRPWAARGAGDEGSEGRGKSKTWFVIEGSRPAGMGGGCGARRSRLQCSQCREGERRGCARCRIKTWGLPCALDTGGLDQSARTATEGAEELSRNDGPCMDGARAPEEDASSRKPTWRSGGPRRATVRSVSRGTGRRRGRMPARTLLQEGTAGCGAPNTRRGEVGIPTQPPNRHVPAQHWPSLGSGRSERGERSSGGDTAALLPSTATLELQGSTPNVCPQG